MRSILIDEDDACGFDSFPFKAAALWGRPP
jgi:hypothetical protein